MNRDKHLNSLLEYACDHALLQSARDYSELPAVDAALSVTSSKPQVRPPVRSKDAVQAEEQGTLL